MGATSIDRGKVHFSMVSNAGYTKEIVLTFLTRLKAMETPGKPIAVFWDNASIHKSKIVKKFALKNNIRLIFNAPYRPDLNFGIETLWGEYKREFRSEVDWLKANRYPIIIEDLIRDGIKDISHEFAKRVTQKGWDMIQNAEPIYDYWHTPF